MAGCKLQINCKLPIDRRELVNLAHRHWSLSVYLTTLLRIVLIYLHVSDACNTSEIWNPGQPVSFENPAGVKRKKIKACLNQSQKKTI